MLVMAVNVQVVAGSNVSFASRNSRREPMPHTYFVNDPNLFLCTWTNDFLLKPSDNLPDKPSACLLWTKMDGRLR